MLILDSVLALNISFDFDWPFLRYFYGLTKARSSNRSYSYYWCFRVFADDIRLRSFKFDDTVLRRYCFFDSEFSHLEVQCLI